MQLKNLWFFLLDMVVVVLSIAGSAYLKYEFALPAHCYDMVMEMIPISMGLVLGSSMCLGVYRSNLDYFGFTELFKQMLVSGFLGSVLLVLKFNREMEVPGSIIVVHCVIFFLFSAGIRGIPRFQRWVASKFGFHQTEKKRVLIVGAGNAASMVVKQLMLSQNQELYPIGLLDDDEKKRKSVVAGVKVLGKIDQTAYFAKKMNAEEILIAVPSASEEHLNQIFDSVANANLPTKIFQNAVDVESYRRGNEKALKEITIEDLLFRDPVQTESSLNREFIQGKVVMVTGGAGSIGSELCRQVLSNGCKHLVIFDFNENGLFQINEDLKGTHLYRYTTVQGSVRDAHRLKMVFDEFQPQLVFHAAAHKHVPMMEINPFEAVKNNVFGTLNVIEQSLDHKCEKFILISTDKAVNPTNVMGATKRVCELLVKAYSDRETEMVAVRFGNVRVRMGRLSPSFNVKSQKVDLLLSRTKKSLATL